MTAAQTITANFTCAATSATEFISAYSPSWPLRNDYTGWVGMQIVVGAKPLSVTSLGRICVAGNSRTHLVKFVDGATSVDIPGGSVTLNMSGCSAGQFAYTDLPSSITLAAGARYFLASQEIQGGDRWYDLSPIVSKTDATVSTGVYQVGTYQFAGWRTAVTRPGPQALRRP